MKKLILILLLLPTLTFGQFSKGTKMIGTDFSVSSYTTSVNNEPPITTITGNFHFGFFTSESFAVGPILNVLYNRNYNINPVTNTFDEISITGLSGGLFARKFFKISDKFFFSLEGRGLIGYAQRSNDSRLNFAFQSDDRVTRFDISILPAFTFFPSERWGIDARLGQIYYGSNAANYFQDFKEFRFNLGRVSLGFNYYFGIKGTE